MIRSALVVGINAYKSEYFNTLRTPVNNAEAIAQRLRDHGNFEVQLFTDSSSLTKDVRQVSQNQEVTLEQLESELANLFMPQSKDIPDTALFYFSGHGFRKTRGFSEGFLATSDTDPHVGNWGLRLKWLRELLQESPVNQQIIWLDCCNSGELLNYAEADPGDRGKARARCFIVASTETGIAYEGEQSNYSVFTEALLEGLDTAESNQWVTNYSLANFLSEKLKGIRQQTLFTNIGEPINLIFREKENVSVESSEDHLVSSRSEETNLDVNSSSLEPELREQYQEIEERPDLAIANPVRVSPSLQNNNHDPETLSKRLAFLQERLVRSNSPSARRTLLTTPSPETRDSPELSKSAKEGSFLS